MHPLLFASALIALLAGCGASKPLTLMSTPVIYYRAAIDPFAHLPETERVPEVSVFYATNRAPSSSGYGNQVSERLHLGSANVRLGGCDDLWPQLRNASLSEIRPRNLPLSLLQARKDAHLPLQSDRNQALPADVQAYMDAINLQLSKARDKEIILYVHGAKADASPRWPCRNWQPDTPS